MPRLGRLHIPGGCYHVMSRGLERSRIFSTIDDKNDFLQRVEEGIAKFGSECLGWSVMPNYYHLLIRVGDQPLSKLMSSLLSGYASSYNRRKKRSGYVFQDRYRSTLCDEDSYLKEIIRDIHLKPLKTKIITTINELDDYPWTGHSELMGVDGSSLISEDYVLSLFGKTKKRARQAYRNFVIAGITDPSIMDYSGGGSAFVHGGWDMTNESNRHQEVRVGDKRILGDSDFVSEILEIDRLNRMNLDEKSRSVREEWTLARLVKQVSRNYQLSVDQIKSKGRSNDLSEAKAMICYFGVQTLGCSQREIAELLGMSQPAVSKSFKRGMDRTILKGLIFEDLMDS